MARPIPKRKPRYRLNDRILFETDNGEQEQAKLIGGIITNVGPEDRLRYYLVKSNQQGSSRDSSLIPVHMTGVHLKEWNKPDHTLTFIFKGEIVLGEDYLWVREDRIRDHWKTEIDDLEIVVEQIRKEVNEKQA